ncbi:AAA-ATPase [Stenotrophomonas phage Siara]|uniref:AAA-ATPase n=1 Tax=Stenotrophomonas phage Siara TaxID=2859658 RepID=A0AAE7WM96_9CAUD|nr:AAA-ATPase [Stenotrophomonas phage Siara]QYW02086.1 AAA-ATPase [Stenotrophomonas phage Siara]
MIDDTEKLLPHQIEELKQAFNDKRSPKMIFMNGRRGGKSWLIERLIEEMRSKGPVMVIPPQKTEWVDRTPEQVIEDIEAGLAMMDGTVVIDSMTEVIDYKLKVRQQVQDTISKLAAEAVEFMANEKPWIAMNDWRNNRGRKNKR